MNFLKKIFSKFVNNNDALSIKDDKTLAYEKTDNAEVIAAKFFFMIVTETSNEAPKINDVYEIIDSSFPEFPRNSAFTVCVKVMAMQKIAQNDSSIWLKIYDNFFSQLSKFDVESKKSILTNIADMGFSLKQADGMEGVAEKYVYRMQLIEKHSGMTKSEYIKLLSERKNNI